MVTTFSLKKDGAVQLTPNFKVREFAVKCNPKMYKCKNICSEALKDKVLIDVDFVKGPLQKIREHFGKPIMITSGYRTQEHNTQVKGASGSYHLKGMAFDIHIAGVSALTIAKYAESIGVKGIIIYPTGRTHIDNRTAKYFSRDGAKTSTTTFKTGA